MVILGPWYFTLYITCINQTINYITISTRLQDGHSQENLYVYSPRPGPVAAQGARKISYL